MAVNFSKEEAQLMIGSLDIMTKQIGLSNPQVYIMAHGIMVKLNNDQAEPEIFKQGEEKPDDLGS